MRTFATFFAILFLVGCVPKSELEQAKDEVESLKTMVSQLERDNVEMAKKLQDMEAALKLASGKAAAMETELSRKPAMPVKAHIRKALLGHGHVLVLTTTVKKDFPVLVTIGGLAEILEKISKK